jgi:hypothetical protein
MPIGRISRRSLILGAAAGAVATRGASAHHGWAWTEGEPFELTGIIESIYLGNPHATLEVRADDGLWDVDLAPPSRTLRAGFDENAASVGDEVTCIGNRAADHSDLHMKAARVIVNGKTYDVYPDRVPET